MRYAASMTAAEPLHGRWYGRHGRQWVVADFRSDGSLTWIVVDDAHWQRESRLLSYRTDGDRLALDRSPDNAAETTRFSIDSKGRLTLRCLGSKGVLNRGTSLVGGWAGRHGSQPVALDFHPDGRLVWIVLDNRFNIVRQTALGYAIENDVLSIERPLDGSVERTPIFFDSPGWLIFVSDGARLRATRRRR